MSDSPTHAHNLGKNHLAIELLARETDTPIEQVEEIYTIECAKLELVARIKTYVPVLASRRVRMVLHGDVVMDATGDEPIAIASQPEICSS